MTYDPPQRKNYGQMMKSEVSKALSRKPSPKPEKKLALAKSNLKPVEEVVCCVADYGTFLSLAERLAETMKTVYYYQPYEEEFEDVKRCVEGTGLPKVIRLDDIWEKVGEIDLFVFPDIGYGGLQRHLKSMGKAVWGSMGASEMELSRTMFIDILKKVGLPIVNSEKVTGITALREYLKDKKDKWVKINRFRRNMETWHHLDFKSSVPMLDNLAQSFGGAKEQAKFVVQDAIESDVECGYDGFCVDGQFAQRCFQGYEKKNELYLGSVLDYKDLADAIKQVNEKMSPVLRDYGYRNWWSTEIRVKDDIPYFIDPTPRLPGMSGEHQFETISNLPDLIWHGAHGELIEAEFEFSFAAEATMHYNAFSKEPDESEQWKVLHLGDKRTRWIKPAHYFKVGDVYHFPPGDDELGVVIGGGKTVEAAIEALKKNFEVLKGMPVHIDEEGFEDLLEEIDEGEKQGVPFYPTAEKSANGEKPNKNEGKKSAEKSAKHGYDFDGVVSKGKEPKKGDVIITGRTPDLHDKTVKQMEKMGMKKVPIHHYPHDDLGDDKKDRDKKIGNFKAEKINELGVKKFFEDTPLQKKIIEKKTDAEVKLIKK